MHPTIDVNTVGRNYNGPRPDTPLSHIGFSQSVNRRHQDSGN